MFKYILIVFFILYTSLLFGQDLYINEFMAANDTTINDPHYNLSSDWLEIYNASPNTIDLTGYHLSDDPLFPAKWQITNGIEIGPYSFLIFWADDFDNNIHTNFKLSRDGEFIGLYFPDLTVVDTMSFGVQETDISFGR